MFRAAVDFALSQAGGWKVSRDSLHTEGPRPEKPVFTEVGVWTGYLHVLGFSF